MGLPQTSLILQEWLQDRITTLSFTICVAAYYPLSGGPALQEESVVGVAFQNLPHAENIGYIIPTPVVYHFLGEVAKYGAYNGESRQTCLPVC